MPPNVLRRTVSLANLDVPVVEISGTTDGPRLTVIAGVHGCEYASMAAVRQWIRGLEARELTGSILAVPVLNLPAFRARSPFVVPDDGKNLDQCFPGNSEGTLAERLGHAAFTQLFTDSDALIDAHAGDLPEDLEPYTFYDAGPAETRARELALAYGFGHVVRQEPGPNRVLGGTTSSAAADVGIPAIIAEAGGRGLMERTAIEAHVRGLDRVLALLGMAADEGAAREAEGQDKRNPQPRHLQRYLMLRSTHEGWWEPAVRPGEAVTEGQVLGAISSLDGARILQTVTAPTDGVPLFVTSSPAVTADGLLLGLGAT